MDRQWGQGIFINPVIAIDRKDARTADFTKNAHFGVTQLLFYTQTAN